MDAPTRDASAPLSRGHIAPPRAFCRGDTFSEKRNETALRLLSQRAGVTECVHCLATLKVGCLIHPTEREKS